MKVTKTKAYFKRFQVKFRRRREGKTDYRARTRLVLQDKNKYGAPKYRLVVRFSNKNVLAQVTKASMGGDIVISSASSSELPRYGLKVGLTNYSAAYCVGLLVARRTLQQLGLDEIYTGKEEVDGEDYNVEADEESERRPFTAVLDTGLVRTSTGARVFAVMKGACDGGMNVPHNEKRLAGYDADSKSLDDEVMRKYLVGGHVSEYMEEMEEEDPDKFKKHFSKYLEEGLDADSLEDMYLEVHQAIRENPAVQRKERTKPAEKKIWKPRKLSYEEKKANLKAKLLAMADA